MNKNEKLIELVEKDFLTLVNLERSIQFALNSTKGRQYQYKVCHAAFRRTCDIMLRRREQIAKMFKQKLKTIKNPSEKQEITDFSKIINSTDNPKHKLILRLLYELKLKPKQIINLKVKDIKDKGFFKDLVKDRSPDDYLLFTNRNKKYCARTIQKIREDALGKLY